MEKKKDSVGLVLCILSFLILFFIVVINGTNFLNDRKNFLDENESIYGDACKAGKKDNTPANVIDPCVIYEKNKKIDFYSVYDGTFVDGTYSLGCVMALLVMVPGAYFISRSFKSEEGLYAKDEKTFKKKVKLLYKSAYKPLIPIFTAVILSIIIAYLISGGFNTASIPNTSVVNEFLMYKPFLYVLLYILKVMLFALIYANITLIVGCFYKDFISTVVISYLFLWGIEVILGVFIQKLILETIFKLTVIPDLSLFTMFEMFEGKGVSTLFIELILFAAITTAIVLYCYQDRKRFKENKSLLKIF